MCASARNMMLRSTDHVCKCKESHHPHPTPPHPTLRRWPDVIADKSKNTLKHHGHLRSVVQLLTSPGMILQIPLSLNFAILICWASPYILGLGRDALGNFHLRAWFFGWGHHQESHAGRKNTLLSQMRKNELNGDKTFVKKTP